MFTIILSVQPAIVVATETCSQSSTWSALAEDQLLFRWCARLQSYFQTEVEVSSTPKRRRKGRRSQQSDDRTETEISLNSHQISSKDSRSLKNQSSLLWSGSAAAENLDQWWRRTSKQKQEFIFIRLQVKLQMFGCSTCSRLDFLCKQEQSRNEWRGGG